MSSAKSQLDKMSTMLFNKSLSTMVKGIRNHKDKGEQEYIMKCIGEIKEELKSSYPEIKAGAVQKLIYLQMLGYDMSWASFNIVEVMSAPWFGHKRIGYLAAALAFTKDTDVILLTTHLFRKGFTQNNTANMTADGLQYETGAAISCLACICTPDLGMDLLSDIYGMMNSSRPYIRKKAVLVLLKIFRAWPQALRLSFDRLKDKLNDENQGVVSAAVYVICELAAKNPTNYLRLAPQFYKILTSSSNNWVLIKVVKLLGSLVPEEPRLAKKLMEPLSDIINTTPAKSLLYECVNTLLSGRLTSKTVIRLCLDKLRTFIEDPDQNLKYLGLLGLHKLMKKHPRVVAEHKDLILDCLKDDDVTIRMRALDLITSMVSKKNLTGIVRRLIDHLDVSDGAYREHVLERIIYICSQENYAYISNFEWYISILVDLTHITGASRENALRISSQLMDVVIRVPAVRRYGVRAMTDLLITERLLVHNSSSNAMSEVLYAAAFLVGEFAEYVEEHLELVTVMLKSQVSTLSQSVQNVFIQSFVKVLAGALMQPFDVADKDLEAVFDPEEKRSRDKLAALARDVEEETTADGDEIEEATDDQKNQKQQQDDDETEDDAALLSQEEETGLRKLRVKAKKRTFEQWKAFIQQQMDIIMLQLPVFTHSNYVEVQERAVCYHAFITWLQTVFNNPQSVLSSSTSTSTQSSTTTSEITIASPPPATTPAPAPVLDLLSQFDPNASSTPPPVAAPTPVPVTPVPTITSPTSSSGPNPRELLRSIANQFAALFSERLNPVNPKAQKKVPIPKGLDLDAQINEEEHDAESESDNESDDGYSLEDPDDKKNKKDAKKKKHRDSDEEETEYVKPTTKEDREEASKRLAARKQRQENDPFYIKDRPNSSGYSGRSSENHTSTGGSDFQTEGDDVDAIPMKRLEDGDLPPVHVKKSDKKSRRKHDLDDDFEEKVTVKNYKIQAADEMPEDAEDSGDDKPHRKASDDELNVDLTTPLGQDEIIPRVQAYNSRPVGTEKPVEKSKMSKEERKAAKAAKKEKRREERGEDKKDKKKKKDKSKDKEKDGDKEKDKKKKKKSEDKAKEIDDDTTAQTSSSTTPAAISPATANVLDLFDPMMDAKPTPAPSPASPPPTSASTKSTPSASPKSEHKSMENGSSSSQPTTEELLKFRNLYHDSRLTIRYRMQPINTTSLALHVEFAYGSKSEKPEKSSSKSLTSLSLEFTSTKPFKFPTSRLTLSSLSKGQPIYQSTVVEFAGGVMTKPTSVPIQVVYSSSSSEQKKKKSEWSIPISVLIQPKKMSLTELGQILSNNKTNQLATKAITLASVSVSTALKLIGAILNVQLIEAVSFTATYYGIYIPDNSHICVLVKAKKGDNKNVSVEIKSNTQTISDALIKECCKELE